MEKTTAVMPTAQKFVSSLLRNRIKLELNAPIPDVWAVVGDPSRMPEYSNGLSRVETKRDSLGKITAYICHFKPMEEGGPEAIHHVNMKWHETNRGWASVDEEPNPFGLQQSLALITLQENNGKTILSWEMHFNCANADMEQMNISSLEGALNEDISQRLLQKFGGKVLESYVQGKTK